MHRYKDLIVWKKSIEMTLNIYELTKKFPASEKYGLVSQARRAAISIPSNIAEGSGKNSNIDFKRFLSIALGSCNELETQLLISNKLNYISESEYHKTEYEIHEVQNMLYGLQKSLLNT
jgi:four helix bundle protein